MITFLWLLKGEAKTVLGYLDEVESLFRTALENARETGERFLEWRIHASLGRFYRVTNHQKEADNAFSVASTLINELGETLTDVELKTDFLKHAKKAIHNSP